MITRDLIPYASYALAADTQALLGCLKEALRRRGLPRKLYADNGGPFVNHHLQDRLRQSGHPAHSLQSGPALEPGQSGTDVSHLAAGF